MRWLSDMKCCGTPHGVTVLGPCLLALTSLSLSNAATKWCDYMNRVVESEVPIPGYDSILLVTRMIGLWSYEGVGAYAGTCYAYPEDFDNFDDYFNFARVMSVLTSVFGGICTLLLIVSSFVGFSRLAFSFLAIGLFLTAVCESLTLLAFKSNFCAAPAELEQLGISVHCEHAWGSQLDISAAILWFCSCLSVCFIPPPLAYDATEDGSRNLIIIHQTTADSGNENLKAPLVTDAHTA